MVVPVPINFSRNDRQVGGRIGHLLGPGALASALADNWGMERADGRGPASLPPAPQPGIKLIFLTYPNNPNYPTDLSSLLIPIIPIILKTYLPYLSQLSQLSSIFFLTYPSPLHAYVADK